MDFYDIIRGKRKKEEWHIMISFVRGELASVESDIALIDVGGVGYGVFMSSQSLERLPRVGQEVKLFTYLNVREDAMQLYGFFRNDELEIFKLLIGVSGIGPKGGLNILSLLTVDELRFAVLSGDVKAISKAPGVGKKTAEKLIIELKDKLQIEDMITGPHEDDATTAIRQGVQGEAIQALVALGYGSTESLQAVRQIEIENKSVEEVLKEALRKML